MKNLAFPLVLAAGCVLACASRTTLVVEETSPIVGPDGKTAEALGIASPYGEFVEVIPQGVTVPASAVRPAPTAHRDPRRVEFALFRGTATDVRDARALGRYWAPRSGPKASVEVTFTVGAGGKISLSARETPSGKDVKLTREP